jgi:hypothetical protein
MTAAETPEVEIDYDGERRTRALYAAVEFLGRIADIEGVLTPNTATVIVVARRFEQYIKNGS